QEEIEKSKRELKSVLDPLCEGLGAALKGSKPETSVTSATKVEPAQARAAGLQLAKLLSEFDPGSADFIETNQAPLRSLFGADRWPQFEKLVQNYSFVDAQAQLEQALKNLPPA